MTIHALGVVTVAHGGTAVAVTSSDLPSRAISIQALAGNTGNIYVGTSALVGSTKVGCYFILGAGETFQSTSFGLNAIDPREVYIDADEDGEGAVVGLIRE